MSAVKRRLISATGAALLAFAVGLLPTVAKRAGTTGVSPVTWTAAGTATSYVESRHLGGELRSAAFAPSFTGFSTTPTSVWLSATWPPALFSAGGWLGVRATHDLQTNLWETIGSVPITPAETNVELEVLSSDLPDGTNSRAFFRLDAQPVPDADFDGVSDERETGWVAEGAEFSWYDATGTTNLLDGTDGNISGMVWSHDLFYPVSLAGKTYSRISIDVNGLVYLVPPDGADIGRYYYLTDNRQLSSWHPVRTNVIVAAYWDNLLARTNFPTRILVSDDVETQSTVVEFGSIGLYGSGAAQTNETLSFQVVLSAQQEDMIRVNYLAATTNMTGVSATIGVMAAGVRAYDGTNFWYNIPWSYNRRDAITPPMSIVYRLGLGTDPESADTDGDGLDDGAELDLGTNPLVADTDGDGLSDGEECNLGTDPLSTDTDGDGLPDGWEYEHSLDPLSDEGNHGANGDLDEDGVPNAAELAAGTNPSDPDTDKDNVDDRMELGWVEFGADLPDFDLSGGTNLLEATRNYDSDKFNVMLPFPVMLAGVPSTNMFVSIDGCIGLTAAGRSNSLSTSGANFDLTKTSASSYHTFVAAYWDDLRVRANQGGQIIVADVSTNDMRYCVVEWRDIGFSYPNSVTNRATFQIVIPQDEYSTVYVRYNDMRGGFTGASATLGAQSPGRQRCFQIAFNELGSVTNGMIVAYRFGSGSSPLAANSDNDELSDGEELAHGTSAILSDTDGDDLPDDWEIARGLNPLSHVGTDGATGDPDEDGLDNLGEYVAGTNPQSDDTDEDGLDDGTELDLGTNPLVADTDGDGLSDWDEVEVVGTDPLSADTDDDGLPDGWESTYGLDPLSDVGDYGANGDYDGDGLLNGVEYTLGTNPAETDTDGDGITDGDEHGGILEEVPASAWQTGTLVADVTAEIPVMPDSLLDYVPCLRVPIPRPLSIGGVAVSNVALDVTGLVYFGDATPSSQYPVGSGVGLNDSVFATNAVVAVPYWASLACSTNAPASSVRLLETGSGTNGCLVVEYANMRLAHSEDAPSNRVSFQVSVPYGGTRRMTYRYADVGTNATGKNATIGVQGWRGHAYRSFGHNREGMVWSGLALSVTVGIGTDPGAVDSDFDGLDDDFELFVLGTDPVEPDTDGDGLDDGWEHRQGFDPTTNNSETDRTDDDADADPDGDGLTNEQECEWGTSASCADEDGNGVPDGRDTDGDGVPDGAEVGQSSDPGDATDGGQAGSREKVYFYFGDHSGSHSEKYRLCVEPVADSGDGTPPRSYAVTNRRYGRCETKPVPLKRGWRYDVRLLHAGTKLASPDYDYTLRLSNDVARVIANDPQHLFAVDNTSSRFAGKGKSAALYVLDNPKVVPDYDRDGDIGSSDEVVYNARQTTFRFWINDDNDTGDINTSENDRPGSGSNGQNDRVNGRGDLLDFTPVLLDISKVFPAGTPDSIKERVSWKLQSDVVNAVWTSLSASDAGSFHRTEDAGATFGPNLSQNAREATVTPLTDGADLPVRFLREMRLSGGKGVIMVEGRASGSALSLQAFIDESPTPAFEGTLDIKISPVEDMYRWMCLRNVCDDSSGLGSRLDVPSNRPDVECDGRHFVFVHGYNVDVQSARGWASEMFKRLWQSGSQSMFTAVDWFGNDSQLWQGIPVIGGESLDYYINVRHALDTALNFSVAANALPSNKIMLAHSLGNMLVSEAARYYLLDYQKYYMLNAAVPMEAYDAGTSAQEMIEHGWSDIDPSKWAVNWYERITYSGDPRQTLKWRGRFAGIHDAINCYSSTEDILANATTNGWGGLWGAQELFKGTATLHFIPGNCEGGWGYNSEHTNLAGFLTDFAKTNIFTDAELIASPIFRKFDHTLLHQTNLISIAQTELNKVLGDGIPAKSFAAGRNPISGNCVAGNILMSPDDALSWPRIVDGQRKWSHSDICKLAFFYVHPIFKKIKDGDSR